MYVALFPCNECAKLIIQSGVKDVVFLSDKYHDDEIMVASRRLFDLAGVRATPRLRARVEGEMFLPSFLPSQALVGLALLSVPFSPSHPSDRPFHFNDSPPLPPPRCATGSTCPRCSS